jgi:hypothetical protein
MSTLAGSYEVHVWLLIACVSEKLMSILARGHECDVWLLIACVSEKLMSILARGHECNVWLLIACVSENYEYTLFGCRLVWWAMTPMFDSNF